MSLVQNGYLYPPTLLSEVQMRYAGQVVDSVHRNHFRTIEGDKGTEVLYLRHRDEAGEVVYKIPFMPRAGLMPFHHRKSDQYDYERKCSTT